MKKSNLVFDGGQKSIRVRDSGCHSELTNHTPVSSGTLFTSTSGAEDETDMAEGITSQIKRIDSQMESENKKYIDFLFNRIKNLEESLSNRNMVVSSLQRELDLMKDVSLTTDARAAPMKHTLSPDSGDSSQGIGSLQSQHDEQLIIKLKQKESEVTELQNELRLLSHCKDPINTKLSNKIVVLESQVGEQTDTIEQLNLEIVQKSNLLVRAQDQLQKKSEEFGKHNMKTSLEIKQLMRSVDELSREVRNKDSELKQTREDLCNLRCEMQRAFGRELIHIKDQLRMCHDEEKDQLNLMHDDKVQQYVKAHETEVACYQKQIEELNNRVREHSKSERELETELEAGRLAHEVQIVSFKERMEKLMENLSLEKEKNEIEYKKQVEVYRKRLEFCKRELEDYKIQIESFNSHLGREVKAVEDRWAEQLDQYHIKCEAQFASYKSCIENLKMKDQISNDTLVSLENKYNEHLVGLNNEIELLQEDNDSLNISLNESQRNEKNVTEQLKEYRVGLEEVSEKCRVLTETLNDKETEQAGIIAELKNVTEKYDILSKTLQDKEAEEAERIAELEKCQNKLQQKDAEMESLLADLGTCRNKLKENESIEESVLAELNKYNEIIEDYDLKLKECNEKFNTDIAMSESRHENVVSAFQNQIDHLISTLAEVKSRHEKDMSHWAEEVMQQQQQVEALHQAAECDSIDELYERMKELNTSKSEIKSLNEKLDSAKASISEYENRLSDLQKCYEEDVLLYMNQIESLKSELQNVSLLEENLVRQLSDHVTDMKQSKEQIRDLLLRKDIQVYLVENDTSFNNFTDSSSSTYAIGSVKFQSVSAIKNGREEIPEEVKLLYARLEILNKENLMLRQEVDNLKKPKCNVSIQPHGNEEQKRHIEQALFHELEKELHDCKRDNVSKIHDIEELIKANNELADHYSVLESQLNDLKQFASEKVHEINALESDKDCLLQEKDRLESNQLMLISKIESLTEFHCKKNVDSLPDETGECNFKFVPSTQNADNTSQDENESPRREGSTKFENNIVLARWIEENDRLESENVQLKNELEILRLQFKEMECCSEAIKNEMIDFDGSCDSLKRRIAELESKKKAAKDYEQIIEQLKIKNEKLEEDRHMLRGDVANLKEENLTLEKKCDETLSQLLSFSLNEKPDNNRGFDSLVVELNKKAEEVIMLKEEMSLKQETITSLEDELDKLLEIRNEMTQKLNNALEDLKVAEEELLKLNQNWLNLELEKRIAEKKLVIVRAQNEHLYKHFTDKLQNESSTDVVSIVEELEKELVELHKNLSAERGVIERMAVEKTLSRRSGDTDESETSYKIELLLNAFEELQTEKEGLKIKTIELQDIINKYVDGNEVDEDWKLEVKESQKRLLEELESYGKQHDVLGKTLIETEDLKAKVDLAEKELLLKIKEKANVEDLLAEERQGLSNALQRINYLEFQLNEKMNVLQVLGEEKEDLQGHLFTLQKKLCGLEDHLQQQKLILESEIQERELRVKHAQLELHAAQLDKNAVINKMLLEAETESEMERVSHLKVELEKEHNMAVSRLKHLYSSQLHEVIEEAGTQQHDD